MRRISINRSVQWLRQKLPAPLWGWLRWSYHRTAEAHDFVWRHARGRTDLPPLRLRRMAGLGDYETIGKAFLRHARSLCGLRPEERVLEIGCGAGRLALPLAGYLNAQGSYVGAEVNPAAVHWCQRRISPQYPNFSFHHMDVRNQVYNPGGAQRASDYRFPFPDASFDCILLVSVFTHLLPADMTRYLEEAARLLVPAGRGFLTFFLLNREQRALAEAGKSTLALNHSRGDYAVLDPEQAEVAVGHAEEAVRALLGRHGLMIQEPVRYGWWAGRNPEECLEYQDVVIVRRR